MTRLILWPSSSSMEIHSFYRQCGGAVVSNNEPLGNNCNYANQDSFWATLFLTLASADKELNFNVTKSKAVL